MLNKKGSITVINNKNNSHNNSKFYFNNDSNNNTGGVDCCNDARAHLLTVNVIHIDQIELDVSVFIVVKHDVLRLDVCVEEAHLLELFADVEELFSDLQFEFKVGVFKVFLVTKISIISP